MYQSDIYEYLNSLDTLLKNNSQLIICKNDSDTSSILSVANILKYDVFTLPDIRLSFGDDLRVYQDDIYKLLSSLSNFYKSSSDKKLIISPIRTLLFKFPKKQYFSIEKLEFAQTVNLINLKDKLYRWGYYFVDIVTAKGEVSFRGDIIDIFPIDSSSPYRISLFDNEIESIRKFNQDTQKSIPIELEDINIIPALLDLTQDENNELKLRVENSRFDVFVKDIHSVGFWLLNQLSENYLDSFNCVYADSLVNELDEIYSLDTPMINRESFNTIAIIPKAKEYSDIISTQYNKIINSHQDKQIIIIARNESIVRGSELDSFKNIEFIYQDGIVNIIGKKKLILSLNKPIKQKRVKRASIVLDELKNGDFVVHENYGVGFFQAIEKREILGATSEFVVIKYQNDDTLLVPVSSLEVIDRFVSEGGVLPVVDKLGKASFKKLKGKVKDKLFAIASQIINLSAQRHLKKGILLNNHQEEQEIFINEAGFIHTLDQKKAIDDMLQEMNSGRMMDRLLSADVGFGKTEVAMNAIFMAIKNGYQAMMIAPTTLLSSQHYKSLKERFDKYDIKIAKIDRFSTAKTKRENLKALENGDIDLAIGTHALLKAKFKNLALVIIDEEHKFGVKQKETLKEMAINVHLLSMSATPIPRSLNLALSQIKTFSEILTPPTKRQGVRTFVKSYDEKIVKEAILRELRRGGQLFYVYNSIAGIEDKKRDLLSILPKLRITILHSKVSATVTEDEMIKFENGEYDLMLSTSIVESGIHLPKVNSMIIEGSDKFGIADLHQLRGRVGRGDKEGYCYFLVEDKDSLPESAKKRLIALESNSELGSGASLAFHDLEIRGGGNIIGEAQSGHIKQIGYALYIRMLEDAIKVINGTKEDNISFAEIKLSINAYLNEELITEDRLRLELYRRLSLCETTLEVHEIAIEIEDRFGKIDIITRQFLDTIIIKVLASSKNISRISSYNDNIFIEFMDESKDRLVLKSNSKDDDDIIATVINYFKIQG